MDYLKYHCFDLAYQNNELHHVGERIRSLSDELTGVLNSLDNQIKSYKDLQNGITRANREIDAIVMRIFNACQVLDQIVDIYYAAEKNALHMAEELPVKLCESSLRTNSSRTTVNKSYEITTAAINSSDLIIEDWLYELVYQQDKDSRD